MEHPSSGSDPVVSNRTMEIVVALLFAAIAIVVMADSVRVGNGWGAEGPQAGYFPFYIGLVMFVSSVITAGVAIANRSADRSTFVERDQLGLVMQVLVPSTVFVVLVGLIGIYLSAILFIAFFMHWVGKYRPKVIVPIAVLIPLALFVMFEIWFLVPLPKGPVETMLGY